MKNSIFFLLLLSLTTCLTHQAFGQKPNQKRGGAAAQKTTDTSRKNNRGVLGANVGYMNYRGKNSHDTSSNAFAFGLTFGRRFVAKKNFTFESLGNFDVIQFPATSAGNEITRRLGGSTLFNPQFALRLTNGQLSNGKKVALGMKLSSGIATNVQSFLKLNFKGTRPDLTLAASPSVAIMLGGGKYIGCELDLTYMGRSTGMAEGFRKGFFITPRFSFQL